jgi:hypothetical protein
VFGENDRAIPPGGFAKRCGSGWYDYPRDLRSLEAGSFGEERL